MVKSCWKQSPNETFFHSPDYLSAREINIALSVKESAAKGEVHRRQSHSQQVRYSIFIIQELALFYNHWRWVKWKVFLQNPFTHTQMTHYENIWYNSQFFNSLIGSANKAWNIDRLKSIGRAKRCGLHTNDSVIILSLSCNSSSPSDKLSVSGLLPREITRGVLTER